MQQAAVRAQASHYLRNVCGKWKVLRMLYGGIVVAPELRATIYYAGVVLDGKEYGVVIGCGSSRT